MSQPFNPIPDSWVEQLFKRMTAIYGSQKIGAMWLDADMQSVKQAWGTALGKYPPKTLADALLALPERPSEWPPTLPEFVTLVREAAEYSKHHAASAVPLLGPSETLADPTNPKVIAARAELAAFIKSKRM